MKKVMQEGDSDCAAACLAMALGMKRSSDVWPLLGYNPSESPVKGVGDMELLGALNVMGRNYHYSMPRKDIANAWLCRDEDLLDRKMIPTEKQIQQKLSSMETGCAIVGVPSLNGFAGGHFVFVHRGNVYDPSKLLAYNCAAYALPVICVIYVQEKYRESL